jgi:hypothetical protein
MRLLPITSLQLFFVVSVILATQKIGIRIMLFRTEIVLGCFIYLFLDFIDPN